MRRLIFLGFFGFCVASLNGCAGTIPLAPGAAQVKLTTNPDEVKTCTAVGNIDGRIRAGNLQAVYDQMKNQAIGAGGNAVLNTTAVDTGWTGIIYRCGQGAT
jgi:hypothetical protein